MLAKLQNVFLLVPPRKVLSMELVLPNIKNDQLHWSHPTQKRQCFNNWKNFYVDNSVSVTECRYGPLLRQQLQNRLILSGGRTLMPIDSKTSCIQHRRRFRKKSITGTFMRGRK